MVEHSVVVMSARLNPMSSQFSILVYWNLSSESVLAQTVETQLRTPSQAVRVQLLLGWNTYVLFNTDIVKFAWKNDEAESIDLLIFVLWRCLNLRWMRGGGVRLQVLFRASWNRIFFQPVFPYLNQIWLKCETPLLFFLIIFYYISFDQQSSTDVLQN